VDGELDETSIDRLTLGAGDAVIVATDGIYEQPSAAGKRLGADAFHEPLVDALTGEGLAGLTSTAQRLLSAMVDRAWLHRLAAVQADDQTIVVLARD